MLPTLSLHSADMHQHQHLLVGVITTVSFLIVGQIIIAINTVAIFPLNCRRVEFCLCGCKLTHFRPGQYPFIHIILIWGNRLQWSDFFLAGFVFSQLGNCCRGWPSEQLVPQLPRSRCHLFQFLHSSCSFLHVADFYSSYFYPNFLLKWCRNQNI